tara:strand:- start:548 stop:748 length:201 start_codon:yes stop_codon:yes gene_type:complete
MKKNKKYKVYTKKGEFHHGYNASLKGSLSWAIDCAKTINGSVIEVDENGEEKEIFKTSQSNHVPVS